MEFYTVYQYDFKIEFYAIKTIGNKIVKDKNGDTVLEENPKYIIETKAGNPVITFQTTHEYSSYSCFTSKKGTLRIYNLPLDFNEEVQPNWGIKLYYKPYTSLQNKFSLIVFGRIYNPEETDFKNGDFEIKYEILTHLDLGTGFLDKKFTPPMQLKGMSVLQAINTIYGERAVIQLSEQEKNKIIDHNIVVTSPNDFQDKITSSSVSYVSSIFTDLAPPDKDFGSVLVFVGKSNIKPSQEYEPLERYGLDFIPQQQKSYNNQYNYYITYWKCDILYTNQLRIGSKVSFVDNLGTTRKCMVEQYSVNLSSNGDCIMNLKLYDEVINAISLIGATEELEEKKEKEKAVLAGAPEAVASVIEKPKEVSGKKLSIIDMNAIIEKSSVGTSDKISNELNSSLNEIKQNLKPNQKELKKIGDKIKHNLTMLKIGIVQNFDFNTQEGTVLIQDFNNLKIHSKNISNISLDLSYGDKVVLIQSKLNLFNIKDNVDFDKNNFYIIASIEPRHLTMNPPKLTLNAREIAIQSQTPIKFESNIESLKSILKAILDQILNIRVTGAGGVSILNPENIPFVQAVKARVDNLLK